jgi:hypothetical protein
LVDELIDLDQPKGHAGRTLPRATRSTDFDERAGDRD